MNRGLWGARHVPCLDLAKTGGEGGGEKKKRAGRKKMKGVCGAPPRNVKAKKMNWLALELIGQNPNSGFDRAINDKN